MKKALLLTGLNLDLTSLPKLFRSLYKSLNLTSDFNISQVEFKKKNLLAIG
jgi:hypothetical protein